MQFRKISVAIRLKIFSENFANHSVKTHGFPFFCRYKDGEEIKPDDERVKMTVTPNGVLKLNIDRVDANDCGAYKAVAINDLGKSIANTAVVVNRKFSQAGIFMKLEIQGKSYQKFVKNLKETQQGFEKYLIKISKKFEANTRIIEIFEEFVSKDILEKLREVIVGKARKNVSKFTKNL